MLQPVRTPSSLRPTRPSVPFRPEFWTKWCPIREDWGGWCSVTWPPAKWWALICVEETRRSLTDPFPGWSSLDVIKLKSINVQLFNNFFLRTKQREGHPDAKQMPESFKPIFPPPTVSSTLSIPSFKRSAGWRKRNFNYFFHLFLQFLVSVKMWLLVLLLAKYVVFHSQTHSSDMTTLK